MKKVCVLVSLSDDLTKNAVVQPSQNSASSQQKYQTQPNEETNLLDSIERLTAGNKKKVRIVKCGNNINSMM